MQVMFWRSNKDLQTIDEGEEPDACLGKQADGGCDKSAGDGGTQLPPDAVAVDMSADGNACPTTPKSPLLGPSLPSASLSLAARAPPAPAVATGGVPSAHTTPQASPPPYSKLARHRSSAMEALGLAPPQLSPRAGSQHGPASGSQTPLRRRRSGDSTPASMPLGFDAKFGGQLPPVRVPHGGGSGSLGGLSREPSMSAAAAARALGRVPRASGPPDIRRSASMQSHLSVRSGQQQAQQAQQGSSNAAAAKVSRVRVPLGRPPRLLPLLPVPGLAVALGPGNGLRPQKASEMSMSCTLPHCPFAHPRCTQTHTPTPPPAARPCALSQQQQQQREGQPEGADGHQDVQNGEVGAGPCGWVCVDWWMGVRPGLAPLRARPCALPGRRGVAGLLSC